MTTNSFKGRNNIMNKKYLSFFTDAIMSGVLLCIGCTVSMSVDSKLAGAFLFSLGLYAIITFRFGLYTGKVGYIALSPPSYIIEVILTILGNICGAAIGGFLLNLTKLGGSISQTAADIISVKAADSAISAFVLAIFCGILMFTAVEGCKRATEKSDFTGGLFVVVLPVMLFILCGFNHCIADISYFFIGKCANASAFLLYIIYVILGNALGCNIIPLIKKLSLNK